MELPKYFFADSPEVPGAGFIIASDEPSYVCKIFKFRSKEDQDSYTRTFSKPYALIPGYRIAIVFFGILGQQDQSISDMDDFKVAISQMASFYLKERILVNEKYHNRYKAD